MQESLAQYQGASRAIPKPHGKAQIIGYAVVGVLLLVVIFAIAIKLQRRD